TSSPHDPAPTQFYTLSLHDALPISWMMRRISSPVSTASALQAWSASSGMNSMKRTWNAVLRANAANGSASSSVKPLTEEEALPRSEEHTSELQSRSDLVCRLLLEKK